MKLKDNLISLICFLAGLPFAGACFLFYLAFFHWAVLGGSYDRESGMAAVFLFLICAPLASLLLFLSMRYSVSQNRWPFRVMVALCTVPLLAILVYVVASAINPAIGAG